MSHVSASREPWDAQLVDALDRLTVSAESGHVSAAAMADPAPMPD